MLRSGSATDGAAAGGGSVVVVVAGTTRVLVDDDEVTLRPKERATVAAIAMHDPAGASVDAIADAVWGEQLPATYVKAVQNHVARIRQAVDHLIETDGAGYRLADHVVVDDGSDADRPTLSPSEPFADLVDTPVVTQHRVAVTQRRLAAEESWSEQRLEGGPIDGSILEHLEALADREPYRERRWGLLALAHARTGRRRDALAALDRGRRHVADIGLPPSRALLDLERRILDDDPTLDRAVVLDPERRPDSDAGVVVGLDDHLAALDLWLAAPDPTPVLVCGEAGVGKTTFATAAAERAAAAGWSVHWSTCSPEPTVPFEPFVELLASLRDRDPDGFDSSPDAADVRQLTPSLPGSLPGAGRRGDGPTDRDELFDAVARLIGAGDRPNLVLIEDVHWASPLTMRLLDHCLRATTLRPTTMILCTSRRDHAGDDLGAIARRIELAPWEPEVIDRYLQRFGAEPAWRDAAVEWIHRQTDGNALFVRELALTVIEQAGSDLVTFRPPAEVPAAVSGSIDRRLRSLPRETRSALEAAAVFGPSFRIDDVAAMHPGAGHELEHAEREGVLRRDDPAWYRFRHELFHRSVVDAMAPGLAAELHDLATRAMEATGQRSIRLSEFARHARLAADVDPERAIGALTESSRQHASQYAWEDASTDAERALELIEGRDGRADRWCRLAIERGRVLLKIGAEDGLSLLYRASDVANAVGDQDLIAASVAEICRLGPTSSAGAVDAEAARTLDTALAAVHEPRLRARVCAAGAMLYGVSDADRSRSLFDEAAALAELDGNDALLTEVLPLAVMSIAAPDDLERREEIAAHLRTIAQRTGRAEHMWGAMHLHMSNQVQRGDPGQRSTLVELDELACSLRASSRAFEYRFWSSTVHLLDGDLAASEADLEQLLAFAGSIAPSRVMAIYGGGLIAVRHVQGRLAELVAPVTDLAAAQPGIGAWHAALAAATASAGDDELARSSLDRALSDDGATLQRDSTYTAALTLAGDAASTVGSDAHVAAATALLEPWSGRWSWGGTCTFGPIDLTLARLANAAGDIARARRHARAAEEQAALAMAPLYRKQAHDVAG